MNSSTTRMAIVASLLLTIATNHASAGLSPENVIVVVNADSYDSRTVANHFVHYRNIPSSNLVVLENIPDKLTVSLDTFKDRILKPLLTQIQSRGLAGQARVIAYSAGFPTTVDVKTHTDRLTNPTLQRVQRGRASINGLTFFYRFILADDPRYLALNSNSYCRGPFNRNFVNPFANAEQHAAFDAADRQFSLGEYEAAAGQFEKLFAASPKLAPLALRAAEAHVKAGNTTEGKNLILKAIAAGWRSREWFEQNEVLAPLIDEPPISSLAKRLSDRPIDLQEPIGFTSQAAWTASGYPVTDAREGIGYLLSCMLGVVHPRASNLEEATEVLERAATSDQTYPDGVFWFAVSNDVRTKTRLLQVEPAKELLTFLGMKAETPFGAAPKQPGRPIGLMLGTPNIKIAKRKWEFVPGAIADNLTSFGAVYTNSSQSKLNVLLHAGAAMSSGTVVEPYSLQAKFPLPAMYAFYASGATAMESFYLSVASPYQLLIVGDPLTQPFSTPPSDQITMTGDVDQENRGLVRMVRGTAKTERKATTTGAIEMYLNGKLVRRLPSLPRVNARLPDDLIGSVEIRTVLIGSDLLQPRSSHVSWIDQQGPVPPTASVADGSTVVRLQCPEATSIDLVNHHEVIGTVEGPEGTISVDPKKFGGGPLRVRPVAKVKDKVVGGRESVVTLPVVVEPFPES